MRLKLLSLSFLTGLSMASVNAFAEPPVQAGETIESLSKVRFLTPENQITAAPEALAPQDVPAQAAPEALAPQDVPAQAAPEALAPQDVPAQAAPEAQPPIADPAANVQDMPSQDPAIN
ncbi:hypothetical protein A7P53_02020 [Acinetobacter defluvii]|uniref:hypothetical protein n=1 Tax=Acinetobacter defluvii TaxID=1871111 RepID=UPI00148F72DC|nr:hypothetical protein [Acinetobacter defluvii]NNP74313.1 hypothetical protein [Acinetobacter defluvii]